MTTAYRNNVFASRLRSLLIEQNFSPQSFAEAVGVSQRTVYNWLNGCVPSWQILETVTTELNVSTAYILGLTGGER